MKPGYPDANSILIVELDGPEAEVEHQFGQVEAVCEKNGSTEIRIASDDAERALFWKGRKAAFAAVGRISPDYFVQDGVIPRTALPEVLKKIGEISEERGLRVANVFHAGDGNLHPLVLYNGNVEGRPSGPRSSRGDTRDLPGDGRFYHRRAWRGRGEEALHAQDVQRERPEHHAAFAVRLRPARALQPWQGLPDPAAVRRGQARPRRIHPVEKAGLAQVY